MNPQPLIHQSIGFTGTRRGMTDFQKESLRSRLERLRSKFSWFHHGDCVGADAEACEIARTCGYQIAQHPPDIAFARALTKWDYQYLPAPYLDRNHGIVNCSAILIAAPATMQERLRSGTWATIRYAHEIERPVTILARSAK